MDEYIIAIPSYKRANLCNEKTLKMLKENHISKDKIFVYVANQEEEREYNEVLNKQYYSKVVLGLKGVVPQRQFIMSQWPEGKHIVYLDDDVSSIDVSLSPRFKGKSLDFFLRSAFQECKSRGSFIWGVYPVYNPFFRKDKDEITTCLNFIVATFFGIINRPLLKNIELKLTKKDGNKDDFERTLLYFINDGIVLRFNRIGFQTKYFGSSGGLGTFEERLKPNKDAVERLKKKYPEYGDIYFRKNGMAEIRLKKIVARTQSGSGATKRSRRSGKENTVITRKNKTRST